MFGIIRTERADHFAQCRRGKPFRIIFGSRQPCETRRQAERTDFVGMARRQYSATNPPSDQPRMSAGVSICAATASAAASISAVARTARRPVRENRRRTSNPRCRQARHQIVEHVAVRPPTVYQVNFFDGHQAWIFSLVGGASQTRPLSGVAYYATVRPAFQTASAAKLAATIWRHTAPTRQTAAPCVSGTSKAARCAAAVRKNRPHSTGCGLRYSTNRPSAI